VEVVRLAPSPGIDVTPVVVGPFQENTFFLRLRGSAKTVVIDPGDEGEELAGRLEAQSLRPVAIVNTHGHLDHIGAVQFLKERYGVPFYLHPGDRPLLEAAPDHARFFGVDVPPIPEVDHFLADGGALRLGGLELEVIHTPGHTPGGVSFAVSGHIFAGDTLFRGAIGRTDLSGGDYETLIRSIRERLLPLPDETIVHCGHGPDTTIGEERRTNPFICGEEAL
jgi:glyoxylase-like metal-dependent hydrolase (beta-lactamase superfamily II)